jgi:hypothetical protein
MNAHILSFHRPHTKQATEGQQFVLAWEKQADEEKSETAKTTNELQRVFFAYVITFFKNKLFL